MILKVASNLHSGLFTGGRGGGAFLAPTWGDGALISETLPYWPPKSDLFVSLSTPFLFLLYVMLDGSLEVARSFKRNFHMANMIRTVMVATTMAVTISVANTGAKSVSNKKVNITRNQGDVYSRKDSFY